MSKLCHEYRNLSSHFNVSVTSRDLQTSRLGLVLPGEANGSVSSQSLALTSRVHPYYVHMYTCVSSAYECAVKPALAIILNSSAVYKGNSNGHMTESCGTLNVNTINVDRTPVRRTKFAELVHER